MPLLMPAQNTCYKNLLLDYFTLCKPKVVLVMLLTAWVGMHLASPQFVPYPILIFGTLGIGLCAGGAAVINHLVDKTVDAKMNRTKQRPIATGRIRPKDALIFAIILMSMGMIILLLFVNTLTALLTCCTMLGYAIFYTLFLKRKTPQNIVIGGIAGAMPPLLGWVAVSNEISAYPLLLVLIIFVWTPPHFWALAIYQKEEYQKAQIPMLPVTHGIPFTKLCIVLYTLLLITITLLPFVTGMSGFFYLVSALVLGIIFLMKTIRLYRSKKNETAVSTFTFSIVYLLLLFMVLLIDHYITF